MKAGARKNSHSQRTTVYGFGALYCNWSVQTKKEVIEGKNS
ncbi:hypothetical protein DaAHT2_0786 [Desulfurivibrio alkaliphilus AHT 2]|uniref:Uncharacterized protein n=1 Tax=Desulfurivibrio alkaliphilus (strain DSM 19089 / UNIQEM U267 / AHT2) TaxID=589865 RepID=D6Z1R5_DESAT|nr:hypothetical protein DaAHT2_0786 [Desulfurivibrio alkaliphilus AHT 2]